MGKKRKGGAEKLFRALKQTNKQNKSIKQSNIVYLQKRVPCFMF